VRRNRLFITYDFPLGLSMAESRQGAEKEQVCHGPHWPRLCRVIGMSLLAQRHHRHRRLGLYYNGRRSPNEAM